MTRMGHESVDLIGINREGMDQTMCKLVPGYMVMGQEDLVIWA